MFGFDDVEGGKKKKKKDKKEKRSGDGFAGGADDGFAGGDGFGGGPSWGEEPQGFEASGGGAFGTKGSSFEGGIGRYDASACAIQEDPIASFEAVIAADREVLKQLRREIEDFSHELRETVEAGRHLERDVKERESRRLQDEERDLAARVQDARWRLGRAREDHRGLDHEGLILGEERELANDGRHFLEQSYTDCARTIEGLDQSNQLLEKHCRDLEVHTETLERERRTVAREAQEEKAALRQEERHLAELRNSIERQRREIVAATVEAREAAAREAKLRQIKDHGPGQHTPYEGRGGHTWAQNVAKPGVQVARQPGDARGAGAPPASRGVPTMSDAPPGPQRRVGGGLVC